MHHRLRYREQDSLHHRRSIWNNISIDVKAGMILLGFGVYTGHDKDIMDLDQIVVFDRTTTTINIWNVQQSSNQAARLIACQSEIITTKMARAKILQKGDQVWEHSRSIFLSKPLCLSQGEKIDVEHNLVPTDVTNHFSGQPFTLMGADLWTCYGVHTDAKSNFFSFSSVGSRRRGRCSLYEGQLPYILFWPCLEMPKAVTGI